MSFSSPIYLNVPAVAIALTAIGPAGLAIAAGSAGVDQYTQGTPGAEGGIHGGATGDGHLPNKVCLQLDKSGPTGIAAAAPAEGTAPAARSSGVAGPGSGGNREDEGAETGSDDAAFLPLPAAAGERGAPLPSTSLARVLVGWASPCH